MDRLFLLSTAFALVAFASAAQVEAPSDTQQQSVGTQNRDSAQVPEAEMAEAAVTAPPAGFSEVGFEAVADDHLIGAPIHDQAGAEAGTVAEIVRTEGDVVSVVGDVGGVMGVAARQVAFPANELVLYRDAAGAIRVHAALTGAQIEEAPDYLAAE